MFVKKKLEEDDFIISDGKYELSCFYVDCIYGSLEEKQPKEGDKVKIVYAFTTDDIGLRKVEYAKEKTFLIKKEKFYHSYTLRGMLVDKKNLLVNIGNITISLENTENCFDSSFVEGDFVEFTVNRLDLQHNSF